LYCPGCGRKTSNARRVEDIPRDPPSAVLAHVWCERCSDGAKSTSERFMDSYGRELCAFCGLVQCADAGCSEVLVRRRVQP
jgi:hypothetical protein